MKNIVRFAVGLCGILAFSTVISAQAVLTWTEPTLNDDGTALTDLTSYDIWYGCNQSGVYDTVETLLAPATTYTVVGLPTTGTCYFAAKAVNSTGISSVFSNEATRTFSTLQVPGAITDTQITWQESNLMAGQLVRTGAVQAGANTGTAVSITHGLTINSGDLVLAIVVANGSSNGISDNNGGDAFTEQHEYTANSFTKAHYWRVAGSSEPSSYAFTLGSSNRWSVIILVYEPASGETIDSSPNPYDVAPGGNENYSSVGTTIDADSMSVTNNNAKAIAVGYIDSNALTFSAYPADSYSQVIENTANQGVAVSDKNVNSGTQIAVTWTISSSAKRAGEQFALKPSVAGSSALSIPVAMHQYARLRTN